MVGYVFLGGDAYGINEGTPVSMLAIYYDNYCILKGIMKWLNI